MGLMQSICMTVWRNIHPRNSLIVSCDQCYVTYGLASADIVLLSNLAAVTNQDRNVRTEGAYTVR